MAPVRALYSSIRSMNIDEYAAQWAAGGEYVRAETGAVAHAIVQDR